MLNRMVEAKAIVQENRQLKAALQLRERSRSAVATGRIVGSSLSSPRRFAILSAGTGDGVTVGMPVRAAEGLVGRVIDAGQFASRVLLDLRPGQHRPGAAASKRPAGDFTGAR